MVEGTLEGDGKAKEVESDRLVVLAADFPAAEYRHVMAP